jgi:hypothetical protein
MSYMLRDLRQYIFLPYIESDIQIESESLDPTATPEIMGPG